MKKDTVQNGRTFEAIGDEAIYLRINRLQKGLLQFTDSTNAERAGQGVWRGHPVHRPLEKTDCLGRHPLAGRHRRVALHQAGLEMVRNIYTELYKTADYRDRMDIEKYAIHRTKVESMRLLKCCESNFDEASIRAAQYIPCFNVIQNIFGDYALSLGPKLS
jgi:hypothetical protein